MSALKLLLGENVSPRMVHRLAAAGVVAEHFVYVGKSGLSDPEVWTFALARDAVVVTINAKDFLNLAAKSEVHAGLIVLRSQGLDRASQWDWLEPVVRHLLETGEELVNKAAVIQGPAGLPSSPFRSRNELGLSMRCKARQACRQPRRPVRLTD